MTASPGAGSRSSASSMSSQRPRRGCSASTGKARSKSDATPTSSSSTRPRNGRSGLTTSTTRATTRRTRASRSRGPSGRSSFVAGRSSTGRRSSANEGTDDSSSAGPSTRERAGPRSGQQRVGALGQEVGEFVVEDEPVEEVGCRAEVARAGAETGDLLVTDGPVEVRGSLAAVVEAGTARPPLPQLRSGDLGRRRVLHEVVDGRCPVSAEPGVEVLESDAHICPVARVGDRASLDAEIAELLGGHGDVVAKPVLLIRPVAEDGVEDL